MYCFLEFNLIENNIVKKIEIRMVIDKKICIFANKNFYGKN